MNGPTHRLVAGAATCAYLMHQEAKDGQPTVKPFLGAAAAAALTGLPDILEPATSPNHRAFFHSLAFAGLLGMGMKKMYDWEPETDGKKLLGQIALVAGTAYLIHLALDFTTRKSLPLVGLR
jgi:inner membrane protein